MNQGLSEAVRLIKKYVSVDMSGRGVCGNERERHTDAAIVVYFLVIWTKDTCTCGRRRPQGGVEREEDRLLVETTGLLTTRTVKQNLITSR